MTDAHERRHWEGPGSPGWGDGGQRVAPAPQQRPADAIPESPQQQHAQIAQSRRDFKPISRAISVAKFGGWTTGFFAVASTLFLVFGVSLRALFVTVGLAVVSFNEFRGAKGLQRLDETAPKLLAWNQIGFAAMLVIYCAWSLYVSLNSPSSLSQQVEAALGAGAFEGLEKMERSFYIAVYVSVALLSIIFQGGTALFYYRRAPMLTSYVRKTPLWIRTMLHSE